MFSSRGILAEFQRRRVKCANKLANMVSPRRVEHMELCREIMEEAQHLPPVANEATPEGETTATGKGSNLSCPCEHVQQ